MKVQVENFLSAGMTAVLGLSGGADSMVLLNLLLNAKKKVDFSLVVVHVNHNLRGKESNEDQRFVEEYCKKCGVKLVVFSVDCKKMQSETGKSLEQCARELRYNCFNEELAKHKNSKLFLAHHKNDRAETILLNLVRGSGAKGVIGIKNTDVIARPLLNQSKQDILNFATKNNIPFRTDSTNLQEDATRNFIRLQIMPRLEQVCSKAVDNICNFADKLNQDELFFDSLVPQDKVKIEKDLIKIDNSVFLLEKPLCLRTIFYALRQKDWATDLTSIHYQQIIDLYLKTNGSKIDLPHNLVASKEYNYIVIFKKNQKTIKNDSETMLLQSPIVFREGIFRFFDKTIEVKVKVFDKNQYDVKNKENGLCVDFDKIPLDAVFRTKAPNDKFAKLGSGSKKLNDYLIDKKIAKRLRDEVCVLASKNDILCVLGYDISEKVKVNNTTSKIAIINIKD